MFGLKRLFYLVREAHPNSVSFFHELVGMNTISWALLEMAVDLSNELIMQEAGGSVIQKDLPVSLRPKAAFFRKAHRQLPTLQAFSARADTIADRILELAEKRHDLIHGYAAEHPPDGVRVIIRFKYQGGRLGSRSQSYSVPELMQLSRDVTALGRSVGELAADVWPGLIELKTRNNLPG